MDPTSLDLTSFIKASAAGVPLVFVVIGFVHWFKQFKKADGSALFDGNVTLLVAMFWGLLLGGGYMVTQTRPPGGDWWPVFVYWFAVFVYGVAQGIVASGLYSAVKGIIEKQFEKLNNAAG
jgi:hypothetical protein